ncbi:MAG: beta-ketoacyl-ACP synthase II [Candidatus Cloacimonetes bacterium]|nr:beta-ketoacyl-ACP synthase II [Candidatus Cloacimonadota bacterium]MBL7085708.1 beta-ketoacyl-ACP synthase II [Candidatus Cloacimonadota bacterium]
MQPKRVVITGLGTINPLGHSVEETWNNLCLGKSGISRVETFDTENIASKIAGQVGNYNVMDYLDAKEARRMDQYCRYAMISSILAMKDSNLDSNHPEKLGVITGTGIGGMQTFEQQTEVFIKKGPRRISPLFIPMMISNIAAGRIAIHFNARGVNFNITSACTSSANAIGEAYRAIKFGAVDAVIACGAEAAVTPLTLAGFSIMRALSTRNDSPETASRPFDLERDGFVLAEGSATLILEEFEHAKKRGAKIYAEMVGYGATCDAFHITMPAPGGEGGAQSMRNALLDAKIQPEDIQYINAHGTSTPLNDKAETDAIKNVFGDYSYKLKINSSKSMLGHTLGAAGAVEALILVKSIQEQKIHQTINLNTPDPDCDLDYNSNGTIPLEIEYGLSNSFGFGGHNATIIFKKYE